MTLRDILGVLARRWYFLVAVTVIALGGYFLLSSQGGVYATKPIIAFVFPGAQVFASDNGVENEGVIAFASAVAQTVNNGRPVERYAAEDAPLYGAGAREEVRIGVPNVGGQWGTSFTRAEIAISVVGRSETMVKQQQTELIEKVKSAAAEEQALRGVPEAERIVPSVLPLSTDIEYISSSTTQKGIAVASIMAAALLSGAWLALTYERVRRHLRLRPGRASGAGRTKGDEAS